MLFTTNNTQRDLRMVTTVANITFTVAYLVHIGHFSIPSIASGQTQVNTFDVGNNIYRFFPG